MISTEIDWDVVCKQYYEQGVAVVDNIISDVSTLNFLREYALKSTHRDAFYEGYSASDFDKTDIHLYKIKALTSAAQKTIPLLNNKHFSRGWFFIYDTESGGVGVHVDPHSDITLNLWVTPDECMSGDNGCNGLNIWRIEPKPEWGYDISNGNSAMCMEYIQQEQPEMVSVEYRFNRAVLFNSNYFHGSQPVRCRTGQENRKINYALLFNEENINEHEKT